MESPTPPPTAGQQLRQVRQARKISLEQVAQATRVRLHYLEALENGNYEILPSVVQGRGFLRAYARYLNLDPQPLLDLLDQEGTPAPAPVRAPVASSPLPPGRAESIYAEIGGLLRQQRELLGISLEDVERHTHLRLHYLKNIEQGQIKQLPSPVQARGMLSNYASFLGMDPEPLLLRFAEGLQAGLAARQAARPERKTSSNQAVRRPSALRRMFSVDLLVGTLLVVFLVVFISWSALRISSVRTSQTATATAPSISEILAQPSTTATLQPQTSGMESTLALSGTPGLQVEPSATPEAAQTSEPIFQPAATPTVFSVTSGTAVQVDILVRQRAWMRVLVDRELGFEGRVVPGNAFVFAGNDQVEVLTGNGSALQVFYNGQDLGTLGILGEVVNRIFTPTGMQTPTPSPTPLGQVLVTPTIPAGLVFPTPGIP